MVDFKIATGNSVTPGMEARTLADLAPPFRKVKGALSQGRIPYPNRHLSFFRWAGLEGFVRDWLSWALAEDESHKILLQMRGNGPPSTLRVVPEHPPVLSAPFSQRIKRDRI